MSLPLSFTRSLRLAIDNLLRNKFLTIATILLMALILLIFNIIFSVNLIARQGIADLQEKVDLIVYLENDADAILINQVVQALDKLPEVTSVIYTTKEEALASLLDKYSDKINPFTTFDLDNPLPASLQIITAQPEDHQTVLEYLNLPNYEGLFLDIEMNAENEQIVTNLTQITQFSEKILFGIVTTFLIGSLLIIANAIHVTIFNRKREIEIMRLVGANLHFIRSPFVIEGAFYGLGSVLLSFGVFILFAQAIDLSSITWLQGEIYYGRLFVVQLLASLLLGMSSSLLAIQHYLNKQLI